MENNFLKFRKEKKLLQKDVAKMLGIATNTYCYYENGSHEPPMAILIALADIFDCTVDELLGRTSSPGIFDDARVPKSEIQELYDQMTPDEQMYLLNSARGIVYAHGAGDNNNKKWA